MDCLNLAELESAAEARLSAMASGYYAGAARDGLTLRENRAAWDRLRLYYRVLVDVSLRSCSTTVLGQRMAMPILAAPTAFHCLAHPDGERATARGCGAAGVALLREVVAACERNPELGREYKHPNSSRSFAAELAVWERAR